MYSEYDHQLFFCAADGDLKNMEYAFLHGGDINKKNTSPTWHGMTPIVVAARGGHTEVVLYLLSKGADPNATGDWTLLHHVIDNGHGKLVETLLDNMVFSNNYNINAQDKAGRTALHLAAHYGYKSALLILNHKDCDLSITNNKGETALDVAKREGHADFVEILQSPTAYVMAMKEGYVSLTNKKLVLMGPPCTGKTAFNNLLFNWSPPKHHHSTPLASRPIRAMERITDKSEGGKVWDIVHPSEIYSTVSDAIIAKDDDDSGESHSTDVLLLDNDSDLEENMPLEPQPVIQSQDDTNSTRGARNTLEEDKSSSDMASRLKPTLNITEGVKPTTTNSTIKHTNEVVKRLKEKTRKKGASHQEQKALHKATWIHVLDSGGQPQFADISRAFLRGNAVNIITHKLTEKLSDKPRFTYSLNGKVMNAPSELQMTNMQLIEHFVRSVGATKSTTIKIGNMVIVTKPYFIIIGTHYDQATTGIFSKQEIIEETIADKNRQLLAALCEFRDHFIFFNEASDELIFPVNNLCWWNRSKISAQIRERIMSQEGVGFKVPIPIRWYMFELQMREMASTAQHGIVSLQSCYEIGTKLKMDRKDVRASLVYFDAMTLCLYYKKVLPNVVFTNPQYLLDMVSDIVRASFVTSMEEVLPTGRSLSSDTQRMLREDGVFEESLLDTLGLPFVPSLFTKDDLLRLLQHISVIAPIDSPDPVRRYFMPVVLSTDTLTERQKQVFSTFIEPLIITFNSKVVLQGLFPTLVVTLSSRTEVPTFCLDSKSSNFPRQLRHAVNLYSEDLSGSVFLCDEYKSITVYFTGRSKHCYTLKEIILQAISTSASTLGYDVDSLGTSALVHCSRKHFDPNNDSDPHPIRLFYDGNVPLIGCSVETLLPVEELKDEKIKCWIIKPETLSDDNNAADSIDILPNGILKIEHAHTILKAIKEVNTWEVLGIHLGLKLAVVEEIRRSNYDVKVCRKALIEIWLQECVATTHKLVIALKAMRKNYIVQKLPIEPEGSGIDTVTDSEFDKLPNGELSEEHAPLLLRTLSDLSKWDELGIALGLAHNVRDRIKIDNRHNIETSHTIMFVTWLQGGTATTTKLMDALEKINTQNLVDEFKKILL